MEKLLDGDTQAVTQLFDGGNCSAAVSSTDDVIDSRLRDTAHIAQLVDGDVLLLAQFQNTLFDRLTDVQGYHLTSKKMIPVCY